jgi:hypothetical protein
MLNKREVAMLMRRLAKSGPQIGDIALSLGGSEKRSLFKERDLTSVALRYPTPPPGAGAPLVVDVKRLELSFPNALDVHCTAGDCAGDCAGL